MDRIGETLLANSLRFLPRKRLSRMMGQLADTTPPQAVLKRAIDAFVRAYAVNMDEAVIPAGGYASFDDFFTRHLVAGARPLAQDADAILSPADGRLHDSGPVDADACFVVKGGAYTAAALLGSAADSERFRGGSYAIVYLAPPDYHRVHAPVTGPVTSMRHVGGTLFPVNALGTKYIPELFAKNERISVIQETERWGPVASVLVGAIGVGRIGLAFDPLRTNTGSQGGSREYGNAGPHLARGDELGLFHLGSTVILMTGPEANVRWTREPGDKLRMGEVLGRTGRA